MTLLKLGVSAAILGWLIFRPASQEAFAKVISQPLDWLMLTAATLLCIATVAGTIVRWWMLVRALHIPMGFFDGIRLGFVGYMFNFASLGAVGGDLFKAFFVIREYQDHRPEAVASVLADRLIGLLGLFLVVAVATLSTGVISQLDRAGRIVVYFSWICGALGLIGLGVMYSPLLKYRIPDDRVAKLPKFLRALVRLVRALKLYRDKPLVIAACLAQSAITHAMFALTFWLMAHGLQGPIPSFLSHFVVVPMTMLAAALPLPGGLGAFEVAMDRLYPVLSVGNQFPQGQGLLMAFGYRAMTIVIALVGFGFYLCSRSEVDQVVKQAKEEGEAGLDEEVPDPQSEPSTSGSATKPHTLPQSYPAGS